MGEKISRAFFENKVKRLCLRWEAIRHNEKYRDDYNLFIKSKRVKPYYNKPHTFTTGQDQIVEELFHLQREIKERWEISDIVPPHYTFLKLDRSSSRLEPDQKKIKQLLKIFTYARAVQLLPASKRPDPRRLFIPHDIDACSYNRIMFEKCASTKFYGKLGKEALARETIINVLIDVTRDKKQIVREMDQVIREYQDGRVEHGLSKKSQKKSRKRTKYNMDIFKTYELVQRHAKNGRTNWGQIAIKRYENYSGEHATRVLRVRNEYDRAVAFINGGYRALM